MKKIIALLLALVLVLGMAACTADGNKDELKVGFIFLHDEQSTYDKNFIDAAVAACKEMNVKMVQKTQIPESNACYEAAVELIEVEECDIIFADSFGHESFLMKAAAEYPEVQFCHATGTKAHTEKLANYHNAFASIYEGRYIAGIVAGVIFALVIVFNSVYSLTENQNAVVTTLGNPSAVTTSGIHFAIPFIQKVHIVDMTVHGLAIGYDEKTNQSIVHKQSICVIIKNVIKMVEKYQKIQRFLCLKIVFNISLNHFWEFLNNKYE